MTVYIVIYYYYDDTSVWGVYSTQELAEAAIEAASPAYKSDLGIEIWELDKYQIGVVG